MSTTVCWGSIRNRDCILYPDAGMFVLIRPTQTFYERIKVARSSPPYPTGALTVGYPRQFPVGRLSRRPSPKTVSPLTQRKKAFINVVMSGTSTTRTRA